MLIMRSDVLHLLDAQSSPCLIITPGKCLRCAGEIVAMFLKKSPGVLWRTIQQLEEQPRFGCLIGSGKDGPGDPDGRSDQLRLQITVQGFAVS